MFKRAVAITVLFVALAGAACSKSGDTASTTVSTSAAAGAGGQQSTTSAAGGGSASSGDLSKCADWLKAYYSVQSIVGVDAAREAQQTISKLDAAAPAPVAADWKTLSPLYKAVADSVVANGQTAPQTNEAVAKASSDKAGQTAVANITKWSATCR